VANSGAADSLRKPYKDNALTPVANCGERGLRESTPRRKPKATAIQNKYRSRTRVRNQGWVGSSAELAGARHSHDGNNMKIPRTSARTNGMRACGAKALDSLYH